MTNADSMVSGYDGLLFDLDGVVYAGQQPIPGAVEALNELTERSVSLAYVTNNASRSPDEVADHLRLLGVPATPGQVFGSAGAGAQLLKRLLDPGSTVLVVGSAHLRDQVRAVGLSLVDSAEDHPGAVIQGFDSGLGWKDLAEAAYAVAGGALWVATNTDMSLPGSRGTAPGNGTLVAAVAAATGKSPRVTGKPQPDLFQAAATELGAVRPLVIGDRLDTDIRGGNSAGYDTALVLTGVSNGADALAADARDRPVLLLQDLTELLNPYNSPEEHAGVFSCADARARLQHELQDTEVLCVDGDPDSAAFWRAACACWWNTHPDTAGGRPRLRINGAAAENDGVVEPTGSENNNTDAGDRQ